MSSALTSSGGTPNWAKQAALLLLFCVAAGLYSVKLGTDSNWDLRNYHLYAPFALLHGRLGFDVMPGQMQSFFNPLSNLPHFVTIQLFNNHPRLVAFLLGAPAGLFAYALAQIAWLVTRPALPSTLLALGMTALITLMGMTGAGVRPLIGTTTNDVSYGGLMLLAIWLVLRVVMAPREDVRLHRGALLAAGFLAGAALGLKLTNIIYAAPLGVVILLLLGLRPAIWAGLAMALGFLVTWGPGAYLLWREFGNPTFPMYNHIFRSEDFFAVAIADERFLPRSPLQAVFYPFYWLVSNSGMVTELRMRDARVALAYLAAVVLAAGWALALIRRQSLSGQRGALLLVLLCAMSYAIWAKLFGIYRYLLLIEALCGVLAFLAIAQLCRGRVRASCGAFAITAIAAMAMTLHPNWGRIRNTDQAIQVAPMPVPPGALLVFIGDEPMSYIVPFLPRDVRIVSITNNLIKPDQEHGLNRRIRRIVAEHQGPIWATTSPHAAPAMVEAALGAYGLRPGRLCEVVRTNLEPGGHRFCEVTR